jgi:hypothetical protein
MMPALLLTVQHMYGAKLFRPHITNAARLSLWLPSPLHIALPAQGKATALRSHLFSHSLPICYLDDAGSATLSNMFRVPGLQATLTATPPLLNQPPMQSVTVDYVTPSARLRWVAQQHVHAAVWLGTSAATPDGLLVARHCERCGVCGAHLHALGGM